jgi:hypothetical protein
MRKKLVFSCLLLFSLALIFSGSVQAQSYYFSQDRLVANVFLNADGTMTIDYTIDFTNETSGGPIDYVDIGLPNSSYDLSSVTASVNGNTITDITKSDYVDIGVALGLGSHTIQPGETGRVVCRIGIQKRMLYPYKNGDIKDYVSFQFVPSYFGSQYVTGSSDITVTFHLPPGITADEPIYYTPSSNWPGTAKPESGFDENGLVYYTWRAASANAYTQYMFGGAFPAKYIPTSAIVKPSIWEQLGISQDTAIGFMCCGGFAAIFIGSIIAGARSSARRKLQYLPPKISVEGNGIKRGLTAVEAAVLMEQPLDKVLTMILFGVVKKNAASVVTKDPLKLELTKPQPEGLNDYEVGFLTAFATDVKADQRKELQNMMIALVKAVTEKMKGFSRKETVAYYEDIIKRAWAQVETAGTPEVKSEAYDKYMEWTMMDKNYEGRTRDTFSTGPVILPVWWGRYDPVYHASTPSVSTPSISGSRPSISMPSVPGAAFASSVVNSVSGFASGVVGDVSSFTSGITNKTNPVPVTTTTSSGGGSRGGGFSSGGGHSCACACACAGCACACAGGGR